MTSVRNGKPWKTTTIKKRQGTGVPSRITLVRFLRMKKNGSQKRVLVALCPGVQLQKQGPYIRARERRIRPSEAGFAAPATSLCARRLHRPNLALRTSPAAGRKKKVPDATFLALRRASGVKLRRRQVWEWWGKAWRR
ncbi:R3H domain-containing protein 4-like [Panicum miliaceum]|uniref:R3H domain-containing protein 4-like n=1 Tax=Panicum miliaceum TaxID=4540 RepID=A0A3L6Q3T6_PANMI|nr:R3H domain-containing protein 4-like [Panicum miliaceum]